MARVSAAAAGLANVAIAAPPVTVAVDPNADRHPVSPLIHGVNFGSGAQLTRIRFPLRRWGGNSTSRYDWENDVHNSASDWFYFDYTNDNPDPSHLPDGSSADLFIDETRAAGSSVLLTVGTIGWAPFDRTRRWGFSVAKYGAQQQTECTASGNAPWCNPDAGNGVHPNGTPITGNDPHDTSRVVGSDYTTRWMAHIAGRVGTAGSGGVKYFALDNETALWNSTHRDVHPLPLTLDELWQKSRDTAAAMKVQDPSAVVFGPVPWGWCEYFYSAADGCTPGADRAEHGGMDLIPWYLKQVRDYQTATGVRLVDVLDVHYYPQAGGVALTNDESAATSALRLRTLKSLYDPAYVDESWIGQPVQLLPRLKSWIAAWLPGTKIAITEYNWGSDDGISGALAQAEALAIFGREGVDYATRWVAPDDGSRSEDAFLLYLNYDGAGGKVAGDSARATSSNVDAVGSYAVRDATHLFVLLFNKDTATTTATVNVAGAGSGTASLFRFSGAARLGAAGTAPLAGGAMSLALPARSATLAVLPLPAAPPPIAASFHTLPPCRVLDTRNAAGPYGGPSLAAGSDRSFTMAGACALPAGAVAVSANVTVTGPAAAGDLRVYPPNLGVPGTTTISFRAGQTRANNAILLLSTDGSGMIGVHNDAPGAVHLILDVNGWFQ